MRKLVSALVVSMLGSLLSFGQSSSNSTLAALPPPTPYSVVSRGPSEKVWERLEYEYDPSGDVIGRPHRFTEVATGLEFWSSTTTQWVDTVEQILPQPDGSAAATNGPHQAFFPADIYSGVVELVTPDGVHLKSRPIGIAYANPSNSVMIATLTNSVGQLLPSGNQIIYTNAFAGVSNALHADLVLTYRKSGVECDLVFRSKPAGPDAWDMNPDDLSTHLQLWTEFFDTQQPATVASCTNSEDGLIDDTLEFGANTVMVPGKTFTVGTGSTDAQANVYKSWIQSIEGRTVLIEELPYPRLKTQLNELAAIDRPAKHLYASANSQGHSAAGQETGARGSSAALPAGVASGKLSKDGHKPASIASPSQKGSTARPQFKIQLPPRRGIAGNKGEKVLLAKEDLSKEPGVWADYTTISGTKTNVLFQSDMTYYVSSTLSLCGTNAWEKGSVLKLARGASITIVSGPLTPQLVFASTNYEPVVFTSVDDSTVGEVTGSGNPSGYYANPALNLQSVGNQAFGNARFLYAQQAISLGSGTLSNYDTQIVNCENGFVLSSATLRLGNCLFANVQTDFSCPGGCEVVSQNSTFSSATNLIVLLAGNCGCHFTNCVLSSIASLTNAGVILNGAYNGFNNAPQFGSSQFTSSSYPFQTVGAGSYYLAADSPFRNVGTTNIDSSLLADIARQTTYPPMVYSNVTLSGAMTFFPQAERNTGVPDLGAHYNPVDYFFGGVTASTNIAFTEGTAAGWFELPGNGGPGYGILLSNAQTATFTGTATNPCVFTRYSSVQEGGNGLWKDKGWLAGIIAGQHLFDPSNPGSIVASFLHSTLLAGGPGHWRDYYSMLAVEATHCEFISGNLGGYNTMSYYTNCLMDRINLTQQTTQPQATVILRNSTWHGGNLQFIQQATQPPYWFTSVRDSAFDSTTMNTGYKGDPTSVDYDYNAFLVNSNRTSPTGPHDVIVTNGYNWQVAWFGNYYLPASSPLIDAGDTNANYVGLYHFTTQTNANAIEGDSIVDIGYHYVGVDGNGNPLDSNGDGIPDYLSDANGNGLVDSGEIEWNTGPDTGLKVRIAQPNRNSPLP